MSIITADAQTEKIFAWRRGFNAMHLIDIGVDVGLFKALAATPEGISSSDLAQQLNLNAHFVNVWCTTAYSFELLEADEATRQFKLAPFIDKILASPGHPHCPRSPRSGAAHAAATSATLGDAARVQCSSPHPAAPGSGFRTWV